MKRWLLPLAAVLLLLSAALPASAAMPDPSEKGSLVIRFAWNGEDLNDGRVGICRIARFDPYTTTFTPVSPLQDSGLDLTDPMDPDTAKKAAALAKEKQAPVLTAPIQDGAARFDSLEAGLYLVVQEAEDACQDFLPITPYLISVPYRSGSTYTLDVVSSPKIPLEPEPTEPPPTKPSGSTLPQTGQLNWPVPLLVVGGLALFYLGWFLYYDGRSRHDET